MSAGWLMTGVVLAGGGVFLLVAYLRGRRAARQIADRESLNDDAIYERYYADSGVPRVRVVELWHEVAGTLNVPPARLRPSDRFGKEIGSYAITSEALDVLAAKGRERAKRLGVEVDLENVSTVDDYVRCFGKNAES